MTEWRVLKNHPQHVYEVGTDRHIATFQTTMDAQQAVDEHNRTGAYVELPEDKDMIRVIMDYPLSSRLVLESVQRVADITSVNRHLGPPRFAERTYRVRQASSERAAEGKLRHVLRHKDATVSPTYRINPGSEFPKVVTGLGSLFNQVADHYVWPHSW